MDVEERVFDDDEKQRAWLEGCRREEAISGLLERHGEKRLSIKDVDEVAWELGVSRATLYRLIAAFRANRTVSSVEPRRRGRRKNAFVLDHRREKLISLAVREIYLKPERPTMTYLIEQVRARCARAELPLPDRRTIKARVDRIDRRVAALKRKDSKRQSDKGDPRPRQNSRRAKFFCRNRRIGCLILRPNSSLFRAPVTTISAIPSVKRCSTGIGICRWKLLRRSWLWRRDGGDFLAAPRCPATCTRAASNIRRQKQQT